jgi:hypothetical protein
MHRTPSSRTAVSAAPFVLQVSGTTWTTVSIAVLPSEEPGFTTTMSLLMCRR